MVGRRSGEGSLLRLAPIRWLVLLTSMGFTSFFLTLASLPYWAVEGGSSVSAAGLVTTLMLLTTVLVQLTVPSLVLRLGSTNVMVLGVLLLTIPASAYLLSASLPWLLVVSAVRGAGFAMVTVITVMLLGSLAPPGRRSEAVGLHGLAVNLPNLVAVPVGVALTLAGQFAIVTALASAPALVALCWKRLSRDLRVSATGGSAAQSVHGARHAIRPVLAPALILLFVCVAVSGYVTFLPIELDDSRRASSALLVFGLTALVVRWRIGVLADRVGLSYLLPAAVLATAVGMLAVGLALPASHTWLLMVGSAVAGVGYGGIQNLTLVASFVRAGSNGAMSASAVWNISFDTGLAVGAVVIGVIADAGVGIPGTYVACAVALVLAVPLARAAVPSRWRPVPD
jgi:predicted MFS family arabinose efflux permease